MFFGRRAAAKAQRFIAYCQEQEQALTGFQKQIDTALALTDAGERYMTLQKIPGEIDTYFGKRCQRRDGLDELTMNISTVSGLLVGAGTGVAIVATGGMAAVFLAVTGLAGLIGGSVFGNSLKPSKHSADMEEEFRKKLWALHQLATGEAEDILIHDARGLKASKIKGDLLEEFNKQNNRLGISIVGPEVQKSLPGLQEPKNNSFKI